MKANIVVAGATGHLGGLIVESLIEQGAEVRALIRSEAKSDKIEKLEKSGAKIVKVDLSNASDLARAVEGADCLVSTLHGLREVIVGLQSKLLEAAISAGVPRFIPSDFSIDFTKFPEGENRNLDLRREFHAKLDNAPIAATSIFNGGFSYILNSTETVLDLKAGQVKYWENPDQKMDFTTVEDVAVYTAHTALDGSAPKVLRISGDRLTARQLAELANEVTGSEFELVNLGSLEKLADEIKQARAADPKSEQTIYPKWQLDQYVYNMFQGLGLLEPLDNNRYPGMNWTSIRELLTEGNSKQNSQNATGSV